MNLMMIWLKPLLTLAAVVLGGGLALWLLRLRLKRWAEKTATPVDDLLLEVVWRYGWLWLLLLGSVAGLPHAPLTAEAAAWVRKAITLLFVVSFTLAAARMAGALMLVKSQKSAQEISALSLIRGLSLFIIFAIGFLLVLSTLGISITPLLAALGVGSLAVALALQDTLANLFSGFYIILARQVRSGDYIQLDSGQEGYVSDIGWRSCTIRQLAGNLIVVPNIKLAQAIVINYHQPDKELAVLVQVGVAYGADLEQVERVTTEVATQVMREVAGGIPEFQPFIRYNAFGDSAVQFTVILRGREFTDRFLIMHEFIKRLHARYRQEGIEIPFPQRVVHLQPQQK